MDYVSAHPGRLRAVVSVGPGISDRELEAMHAKGARGIRANIAENNGIRLHFTGYSPCFVPSVIGRSVYLPNLFCATVIAIATVSAIVPGYE